MRNSDPSNSPSIRDLPQSERPRERLWTYGPRALSDGELLAIILRTGTATQNARRLAEQILAHYGGLEGLAQASPAELEHVKGLGRAKVAQVAAALELGKRLLSYRPDDRPAVEAAVDAARLVMDMGDLPQEHVRVILLDSVQRVIAIPTIYMGTLNASVLRTAEVFREAIARNSPAIILAHNHPSGDPSPSPQDIELTRVLASAGRLLDIALLDHVIIGRGRWVSLKEQGFLQ